MEAGRTYKSLEVPPNYFGCHIHVALIAILMPVAALLGALFLVWVDIAARTWLAPQDLPIGIVTAAIGGVFFVALLRRR